MNVFDFREFQRKMQMPFHVFVAINGTPVEFWQKPANVSHTPVAKMSNKWIRVNNLSLSLQLTIKSTQLISPISVARMWTNFETAWRP